MTLTPEYANVEAAQAKLDLDIQNSKEAAEEYYAALNATYALDNVASLGCCQ